MKARTFTQKVLISNLHSVAKSLRSVPDDRRCDRVQNSLDCMLGGGYFSSRALLEERGMNIGDFFLRSTIGIVVSCDRFACSIRRAGKRRRMSVVGKAGCTE